MILPSPQQKILTVKQFSEFRNDLQNVVFTNGCFDIIHAAFEIMRQTRDFIPDPHVFFRLKVCDRGNRFTGCGTAGNPQRGRQCDDPGKHFLFFHDSFPPLMKTALRRLSDNIHRKPEMSNPEWKVFQEDLKMM